MKRSEPRPYSQRVRRRIWLMRAAVAAMLVYMVAVAELGGGDSRRITELAAAVSKAVFFGGLGWLLWRISFHKRLLKSRAMMQDRLWREQDERRRYLHDKSGGAVMDALLAVLLCATVTAALFDTAAFYTALAVLLAALALKGAAWLFYSRG